MADYKLLPGGAVLRDADKAVIPPDTSNKDWKAYQAWAGSNTPDAQTVSDLDFAKQRATERVEAKAARAYADALGTRAEQMDFAALLMEGFAELLDQIPGNAQAPMLASRIDGTYTTRSKVAQRAIEQFETLHPAVQTAFESRAADLAAIAAAATVGEADAIATI